MSKKNKTRAPMQAPVEAPIAETATPATRTMEVKIGIANRCNHAITIVLKKDSLVLSAAARTGKDYKQNEIVSVNGFSLAKAINQGICTIVR